MASELIGRAECPECGFHAAHIKIKTDKEGALPYRHCPECGAQYFPRNQMQADNLRKTIRPGSEPNTPREAEAGTAAGPDAQTTHPAVTKEPQYKTVFGVRVPV